jgi:hypothetical protein
VAKEWVNRPWPYEITPPQDNAYPAPRGLLPAERKYFYSVIAAARPTETSTPRTMFPVIFGAPKKTMLAFAQAEMFNWMEFNGSWGGSEHYDEITMMESPTYYIGMGGYQEVIPIPQAWRACSAGGWQNRPRLSLGDALMYDETDEAMNLFGKNDELRTYFDEAGMTVPSGGVVHAINLH